MEKVAIVSFKDKKEIKRLSDHTKKYFNLSKKPDFVVSFGGDGTFFSSERKFPGIPKITIRNYNKETVDRIYNRIKKGKYKIKEHMKLEAEARVSWKNKGKIIGLNDIIIKNKNPCCALRYSLEINGKKIKHVFIGDGIVIATPYGSTGYFYSISRKKFKKGIGLAFNNLCLKCFPKGKVLSDYKLLTENSKIVLKVLREEATLSADNCSKIINLNAGDSVEIRKSDKIAKILKV